MFMLYVGGMRGIVFISKTPLIIFMLAAIMIGRPGRRYVKQERNNFVGPYLDIDIVHRFFMSENSSPGILPTFLLDE